MGISEFAVHNVLRTYSRQERVGRLQRPQAESSAPSRSADQVSLSAMARKAQVLGQVAAEVVDVRHPGLAPEERSERLKSTKDELLKRHVDGLRDEKVGLEDLEAQLRDLYLR